MCVVLEVCATLLLPSGYPQEYVVPVLFYLLNREMEMHYIAAGSIFKGWEIHSEVVKMHHGAKTVFDSRSLRCGCLEQIAFSHIWCGGLILHPNSKPALWQT